MVLDTIGLMQRQLLLTFQLNQPAVLSTPIFLSMDSRQVTLAVMQWWLKSNKCEYFILKIQSHLNICTFICTISLFLAILDFC